MFKNYILSFVPIFVAVDALGMLPVFMGLTAKMSKDQRETLIKQSVMTALLVALSFIWVGKFIFDWLGVTISDFLVAGGAILFIISIRDLLASAKSQKISSETIGVVPIAVPLIVGPAVLTTSLILLNSFGVYPTVFSIVANIILCGAILYSSTTISKLLGDSGSQTLSKISSLLLAAIGVMLIRRGLQQSIGVWIATGFKL